MRVLLRVKQMISAGCDTDAKPPRQPQLRLSRRCLPGLNGDRSELSKLSRCWECNLHRRHDALAVSLGSKMLSFRPRMLQTLVGFRFRAEAAGTRAPPSKHKISELQNPGTRDTAEIRIDQIRGYAVLLRL